MAYSRIHCVDGSLVIVPKLTTNSVPIRNIYKHSVVLSNIISACPNGSSYIWEGLRKSQHDKNKNMFQVLGFAVLLVSGFYCPFLTASAEYDYNASFFSCSNPLKFTGLSKLFC